MPKNQNKKINDDVTPGKRSIREVEITRKRSGNVVISTREAPVLRNHTPKRPLTTSEITPAPLTMKTSLPLNGVMGDPRPLPPTPSAIYTKKPQEFKEEDQIFHKKSASSSYEYEYDVPEKKNHILFYSLIILLVAGIGFGVSVFFKSAEIKVTPRSTTEALSASFTAYKDSPSSNLSYQVVTTSTDLEAEVPSTKEEKVSRKASGVITISNTGMTSQKLIATTRLQTAEGLVFRMTEAVTIPAAMIKGGSAVPGVADVKVEADKAGSEYNVPPKDFTLPGLKGTPRFTEITGKSKSAIAGGIVGNQKVLTPDVLQASGFSMEKLLQEKLAKDITSQIPADLILYPASISYSFGSVVQTGSDADGVILKKKGTISGILFDKGSLTRAITAKAMPEISSDAVKITNLDALSFAYATGTQANPNASSATFTLTGNTNIVWSFDLNVLKTELLGLSKEKAKELIDSQKSISEAWIQTKPFWNRTIPKDPTKVKVINTLSN